MIDPEEFDDDDDDDDDGGDGYGYAEGYTEDLEDWDDDTDDFDDDGDYESDSYIMYGPRICRPPRWVRLAL